MKDQKNISFDEQIKSAFEGARLDPPAGVWDVVSSQIAQQAATGVVKTGLFKTVFSKIVAVAVMGTAVTGGGYLVLKNNTVQKESVEIKTEAADETAVKTEEITPVETREQEGIPSSTENQSTRNQFSERQKENKSSQNKENITANQESKPGVIAANREKQTAVTVEVQNNPTLALYQPDSVFCPGEIILFSLRSQTEFEKVQWEYAGATLMSSDAGSARLKYTKEGVYEVKAIGIYRQTRIQVSRKVYIKNPVLTVVTKNESDKVMISAGGDKFTRYSWAINGKMVDNVASSVLYIKSSDFQGMEQVNVQVKGFKNEHCEASEQTEVKLPRLMKDPFVPNVFTPTQKDGKNDCFSVEMETPEMYFMLIKNRNGAVVFESNDPNECWNGRVLNKGAECPPDAYFYQFMYKMPGSDKVSKNGRLQLF